MSKEWDDLAEMEEWYDDNNVKNFRSFRTKHSLTEDSLGTSGSTTRIYEESVIQVHWTGFSDQEDADVEGEEY